MNSVSFSLNRHFSPTPAKWRSLQLWRLISALLVSCFSAVVSPVWAAEVTENRLALLIGNANYRSSPLSNPINDVRLMDVALTQAGFTVIKAENASIRDMRRLVRDFGDKLKASGGVGLFYFAGHGVQVRGDNFLVSTDSDIRNEDEIADDSLNANVVLEKMQTAGNRMNLIILDACRNNPFAVKSRAAQSGLATMSAPSGSLVAYSTAPGSVASDGVGKNGLYTEHLAKVIRQPGLPVEEVFKQVRSAVRRASNNQQTPWENTALEGQFYFVPNAPLNAPVVAIPPPAPVIAQPSNSDATRLELSLWDTVKNSGSASELESYIERFPQGVFAGVARSRITMLNASTAPIAAAIKPAPPVAVVAVTPVVEAVAAPVVVVAPPPVVVAIAPPVAVVPVQPPVVKPAAQIKPAAPPKVVVQTPPPEPVAPVVQAAVAAPAVVQEPPPAAPTVVVGTSSTAILALNMGAKITDVFNKAFGTSLPKLGVGSAVPAAPSAPVAMAANTSKVPIPLRDFMVGTTRFSGRFVQDPGSRFVSGEGQLTWANGDMYEGTLVAGKRQGVGKFVWGDGQYVGSWVDDRAQGQGALDFKNGNRYAGNVLDGLPEGEGRMTYASGDTYQGSFAKGKAQGRGTYEWRNGQRYQGEWSADRPQGTGSLRFANGNQYDGDVANGVPEGIGKLQFATGDSYQGMLRNGLPEGDGEFVWKNGDRYKGEWRAGLKEGRGLFVWSGGQRWEGIYRNDQQAEATSSARR